MPEETPWRAQSPVTDPGAAWRAIDRLPDDLATLREVSSKLVFHYRAGGDFATNGVAAERVNEIDTRYADAMFERLFAVGSENLDAARAASERLVGCCRDATVLFLSMARAKGFAARARVGFATYIVPGWYLDHVVAEVWDESEGRWRLVDPDMEHVDVLDASGRPLDWFNLDAEQFITGSRAWLGARSGALAADSFVVAPDLELPALRGWPYLAHNLIHDLAALNRAEMLLWDTWGLLNNDVALASHLEEFDELAAAIEEGGNEALSEWFARPGYALPVAVTSFSPALDNPIEVDVTRLLVP